MKVEVAKTAKKQLRKAPIHIVRKFEGWVRLVEHGGLEASRRIPGYNDEALVGNLKGKRSIRLSKQWRAIYSLVGKSIEIVLVEEVTPHEYKK